MAIRIVSIAAHSGTGKTTLSEALLYASGAISRLGKVEDGTTHSDHSEAEKQHGFSINTGVLRLSHRDTDITLLDTPGYADFVREIRGAVRAADSSLILVSAISGAEVGTERVWATADRFEMPRIVAINKMDGERADFFTALASIKALNGNTVPLYLPIGEGANFEGLVNVLTHQTSQGVELPTSMRSALKEAQEQLTESIVETNDELLSRYLEGEEISPEDLQTALLAAIHSGQIYPALPVSASKGIGLNELLDLLVVGLRSARERGVVRGTDEEQEREPKPEAPFSARVWRMSIDPYVGKEAFIRVWSGTLKAGETIYNSNLGVELRPAHLYVINGKELTEVPELTAGMVGVLTKIEDLHTGDTLCDKDNPIQYDKLWLPEPVYTLALHPTSRQDEDKLGTALTRLMEEDPTLRFEREPQTGEQLLSGMGEMHLKIAIEKLAALGVRVETTTPQIPYRETIHATAEAQGKHKKQSGGHGQYGDCKIRIEHAEGYQFNNAVVGGSIPSKYIPSIDKGIQEAMQKGTLAGYPLQDIKVTVLDGSYHDVDSSDIAFRTAGSIALKNALANAKVGLLEPVQLLRVRAPMEYTGDLISDLQTRRARVQGMEPEGTTIVIRAVVPQAALQNYSADLRSLTGGRGAFSLKFHGYQDVPENLVKEIVAERKRELAEV